MTARRGGCLLWQPQGEAGHIHELAGKGDVAAVQALLASGARVTEGRCRFMPRLPDFAA